MEQSTQSSVALTDEDRVCAQEKSLVQGQSPDGNRRKEFTFLDLFHSKVHTSQQQPCPSDQIKVDATQWRKTLQIIWGDGGHKNYYYYY